jgi:extracellular elastinolytic metalloproteinase
VTITIAAPTTTQNFSLRRDWAALGGGARVTAFNGPDFTAFGCGPANAIDQSLGSGWGSTSDLDANGVAVPKFVTVELPEAVNILEFAIDPGETCGDDPTAATKDFRLETSTDGTTFVVAASGTFDQADNHRLNPVAPNAGTGAGVKFVRFTMINPQLNGAACPGPASGCLFLDMSELEVYGLAS